jgi:hypothetical protein
MSCSTSERRTLPPNPQASNPKPKTLNPKPETIISYPLPQTPQLLNRALTGSLPWVRLGGVNVDLGGAESGRGRQGAMVQRLFGVPTRISPLCRAQAASLWYEEAG